MSEEKMADEIYCASCGKAIKAAAEICPHCGVRVNPPTSKAKERLIYILLCIFLGTFGIHNFYAGYNLRGVVQLLLTLGVGSWTCFIGAIPVFLWNVVELFVIDKDANGVPFK